ncbi:DUF481 domain-containing protein [Alkalicaulis satelles]|uniref:DUF481 domain-containing protein n=1 Tax=Alkalicaulis satelles TaxID=2609175 RepID=A0A5M6ZFF0_9PROT|nr:DUF481 domain-containing protein [Alkalicaulis satelles]KAA5803492.1 DUF481 domain-containing protein [Alkalicaulis satelles]
MRALFAASPLAIALSAAALADAPRLPDSLYTLLGAAHETGDAEVFAQAVRLIALTQEPEVVAAGADALSAQAGARARAALGLELMAVEAVTGEALEDAGPDDDEAEEPAGPVSRAIGFVANGKLEHWSGRVRAGLRYDTGNVEREDYTFGLQVTRALAGWGFEGAIDYNYSEIDSRVGRDELIARARGERERGERWTNFIDTRYEQDQLSGFDWKAFAGGGLGYRVYARDDLAWTLRAAPGARWTKDVTGDVDTFAAFDLGSEFQASLTDAVRFTANTNLLFSERSQADQVLALNTALGAVWSVELRYRYRHQFNPEPGFQSNDSRADVALVREF